MSNVAILQHYLGPLQPLIARSGVTELVVNRPGEVGIETSTGWTWHACADLTPAWLSTLATAAAAFTRQDVGPEAPLCATILPGGERCQIVMPPAAEHLCLTVRKPAETVPDLAALAAGGLFSETEREDIQHQALARALKAHRAAADWPAFFRLAVEGRKTILVSGATGSGKTTFARALMAMIPREERLITVEDTRELSAPHRNLVHLIYAKDGRALSGAGPKQLLEGALRMRPDRVIFQELRDDAAFYYLRNVCSGHPGSITTVHADSPTLAFEQLSLLVRESEAGRDLPRREVRMLLSKLIDVVVQLRRIEGRFRVTEVWYEPPGLPPSLA